MLMKRERNKLLKKNKILSLRMKKKKLKKKKDKKNKTNIYNFGKSLAKTLN
jgi:hypothetical protein